MDYRASRTACHKDVWGWRKRECPENPYQAPALYLRTPNVSQEGTDGSNPVPSSSESSANLTRSINPRGRRGGS